MVRRGERVEFSVVASGAGTLVYQWRHDGDALPAPSARTANLIIEAADFDDAGDYDVEVSLAGVNSRSVPVTLVVHDEEHTSFAAWASAHGVAADPSVDPDDPEGSANGGGTPALFRYAFKQAARGALGSPSIAEAEAVDGERYLSLRFPRKTHAPGLRYVVEASDDLVNWQSLATVLPGRPETVTVRDDQALSETRRRFMRVRVELGP